MGRYAHRPIGIVAWVLVAALGAMAMVGVKLPNPVSAMGLPQVAGCSASSTSFVAVMNGNQETPAVTTTATGIANLQLDATAANVTITINTTSLDVTQVTQAHIHSPGVVGVAAPVSIGFFAGPAGTFTNPFSATVAMNATVLAAMQAGTAYVNIHTTANPTGEIRGQIACGPAVLPATASTTTFNAVLNGAQETPPNTSPGQGVASVVLDATATNATITLNFTGVTPANVTRMHIHSPGVPGVAAPITVDYFNGSGLASPFTATLPVTSAVVSALRSGTAYVNLHSAAFPGGEIRGQLGAAASR